MGASQHPAHGPGVSCPAASPAAVPHILGPPEMWGARCARVEAERSESDGATSRRILEIYPQRSSAGKQDAAAMLEPRPRAGWGCPERLLSPPLALLTRAEGSRPSRWCASPPEPDSQTPLPPRAASTELVGDRSCPQHVPRAHTPSTPPTALTSVTSERLGKSLQSAEPHADLWNQHS